MSEILQYRKQFYESSYDIRVICARGDSAKEISDKVMAKLKETTHNEGFTSTREEYPDREERPGFLDVVLEGLAPDGGLYVPKRKIPHLMRGKMSFSVLCLRREGQSELSTLCCSLYSQFHPLLVSFITSFIPSLFPLFSIPAPPSPFYLQSQPFLVPFLPIPSSPCSFYSQSRPLPVPFICSSSPFSSLCHPLPFPFISSLIPLLFVPSPVLSLFPLFPVPSSPCSLHSQSHPLPLPFIPSPILSLFPSFTVPSPPFALYSQSHPLPVPFIPSSILSLFPSFPVPSSPCSLHS